MVWLGPLLPTCPDTGGDLVPVDHAQHEDLEWLTRVDSVSGRYAARYVASDPDRVDQVTGWVTTELIR
jgi:hypothetical protein